jgi:hypothetical protein
VRSASGGDQEDLLQAELPARLLDEQQMADVRRIEGPAEDSERTDRSTP